MPAPAARFCLTYLHTYLLTDQPTDSLTHSLPCACIRCSMRRRHACCRSSLRTCKSVRRCASITLGKCPARDNYSRALSCAAPPRSSYKHTLPTYYAPAVPPAAPPRAPHARGESGAPARGKSVDRSVSKQVSWSVSWLVSKAGRLLAAVGLGLGLCRLAYLRRVGARIPEGGLEW